MTHASAHDGSDPADGPLSDGRLSDGPIILPMPAARGTAVRKLLESIIAAQADARAVPGDQLRVTLDVPASQVIDADPEMVRGLLEPLVAAAIAAASHPAVRTDGPRLREVVVTGIDTADAFELEIADSGSAPVDDRSLAACCDLARRCGAEITAMRCPEGGTAVTLRLARRRARRHAA